MYHWRVELTGRKIGSYKTYIEVVKALIRQPRAIAYNTLSDLTISKRVKT